MPLQAGSRLGPYEVLSRIGAGGMGEVYRARDTNLGRDVALKVLPGALAREPERIARFRREARTLASLNHPHIAHIYGLEESGDTTGIVTELVEGDDLSQRIARGPLALDVALPLARQIADALEAAHRQGIIHRDLKPANIKVRGDGTAKVLDFGLAKAIDDAAADRDASGARDASTITSSALTMSGTILGTAAYMSPEQARGQSVDERADIWAFGCVLYEMLAGRRAFEGKSVTDTIAAVITREPDWSALPATTPAAIGRLLRRCLRKEPSNRLRHMGDAALEVDEARAEPAVDARPAETAPRRWRLARSALFIVLSAAASAVAVVLLRPVPHAQELRVEIATPPTDDPSSLAIAPDGQSVVFVGTHEGRPRLWLRSLKDGSSKILDGTDGAALPFWAPTGRSLAFFTVDGRLKQFDIEGGAVRTLDNASIPRGGTWSTDDTILFVPMTGPVFRISASGGERTPVTRIEAQQTTHTFPTLLNDGKHFVFGVKGTPAVRGVYVAAIDGSDTRRLVETDASMMSVSQGHVLWVRDGTLLAQPIDTRRLELMGDPITVVAGIAGRSLGGERLAAMSSSSRHILYRTGPATRHRQFAWFDRAGRDVGSVGEPDEANPLSAAISPDGRQLAMHRVVDANVDIWLLDTVRGSLSRLTTDGANDIHPLWSQDGRRIFFASNRGGSYELYEWSIVKDQPERKVVSLTGQPTDLSRDGRILLFNRRDRQTNMAIWMMPLDGESKPSPVVPGEYDARDAQFSNDGRWIAYSSAESGRTEIYVQPFPGPGQKAAISIGGGAQPRWRKDGTELFYIRLDGQLMVVPIALPQDAGAVEAGTATPLFATRVGGAVQMDSRPQYIVSPDGQRFLMNTVVDGPSASPIALILNWKPPVRP